MSEFKNRTITNNGLELLSKALSGGKLEFTKIVMGSGTFTGDTAAIEDLVQIKQTLPIINITRKGTQVTLSASLTHDLITSEYDWSEVGVYAKGSDDVEVLYMYGYTENTSYISKDSLNEKLITITVLVSNVSNVTAHIDSSLVYLTADNLEDHNMDEKAHPYIQYLIEHHTHEADDVKNLPTDADTVDGKHANEFVLAPRKMMALDDIKNANYPDAYRTIINDGTSIGLPSNGYYHIDYFRHTDNNGFGRQVAYSLNHDGATGTRRSNGTSWGAWSYDYDTTHKPTPADIGAIPTTASCNKNWNWNGQGGQPTWLWGGNDPTNMYVYNPANFTVNYADGSNYSSRAYHLATQNALGQTHGTNHLLYCRYNALSDNRFALQVAGYETRVDYASNSYQLEGMNFQQLRKKIGGDYMNKNLETAYVRLASGQSWSYTNANGGIAIFQAQSWYVYGGYMTIVTDGKTIINNQQIDKFTKRIGGDGGSGSSSMGEIIIPFDSYINIQLTSANTNLDSVLFLAQVYTNK